MKNPFLINTEFGLKVVHVTTTTTELTKADYISTTTTQKRLVEVQRKVSAYKTGNSAEHTAFLFSMNRPGRDLYLYIIANIGENKDTIRLDREKVPKAIGCSINTFYTGIDSLKDTGVIAVHERSVYWVNPYMIFRGDRIAYYREQCPDCIENVSNVYREEKV